jgi:hypothetical protein
VERSVNKEGDRKVGTVRDRSSMNVGREKSRPRARKIRTHLLSDVHESGHLSLHKDRTEERTHDELRFSSAVVRGAKAGREGSNELPASWTCPIDLLRLALARPKGSLRMRNTYLSELDLLSCRLRRGQLVSTGDNKRIELEAERRARAGAAAAAETRAWQKSLRGSTHVRKKRGKRRRP